MIKPMTSVQREKIRRNIKNRLDISDLIKDYKISRENFDYAIIERMIRPDDTIVGASFINAVIGHSTQPIILSGATLRDCSFKGTNFIGTTYFRSANCTNCNFSEADLSRVEYQRAKFTNCRFCETVMRLGSRLGMGAQFDKNLFKELSKWWGVDVRIGKEVINDNRE